MIAFELIILQVWQLIFRLIGLVGLFQLLLFSPHFGSHLFREIQIETGFFYHLVRDNSRNQLLGRYLI
jgi:hypothetical protein